MKVIFRILFFSVALMVCGSAFSAVQGKNYTLLATAQTANTKKIEVLEFFFYGCSHCYHLHGQLSTWEKSIPKDVELTYVPTAFRDSWEPMARTFYAAQAIGALPKLHDALYQAWNVSNIDLSEEPKILDFVAQHGVDRAKFSASYNSFSIPGQVNRAKQMLRSYQIDGTPTLIVDGKYKITGLQPEDSIRVLNAVIDMVRKTRIPAESKSAKAKK
jgi:thiol:disulfide interchange protein DsbA